MNTPASRQGNLIRYLIYFISYLMVAGVIKLVTANSPIHIWDLILFATISLMVSLFLFIALIGNNVFLTVVLRVLGLATLA